MKKAYQYPVFLLLILATVTLLSSPTTPAGANSPPGGTSTWEIETIDSRDDVGPAVTIALDKSGAPHLAYRQQPDVLPPWLLQYAALSDGSWQVETIYGDGGQSSLVVDDTGRPQLSFHHQQAGGLSYAIREGNNWQVTPIDTNANAGGLNRLALDSTGRAHIIYSGSQNTLRYAQWNGSGWDNDLILTTTDPLYALDFALDSADRPHLVYREFNCDMYACISLISYRYWDGNEWQDILLEQEVALDNGGDVGFDIALALDSAGNPHVAYFSFANWSGTLVHTYWDSSTFTETIFTQDSKKGGGLDLALDNAGHPHIAFVDEFYQSSTEGILKYAWWTGTLWLVETVHPAGSTGPDLALALAGNQPHIPYRELENLDLNLARGDLTAPANLLPIINHQP
jgi:hypothetical protein